MLTKKHFEAIAKILAVESRKGTDIGSLVLTFSEWFQLENPNFNAEKFEKACYDY